MNHKFYLIALIIFATSSSAQKRPQLVKTSTIEHVNLSNKYYVHGIVQPYEYVSKRMPFKGKIYHIYINGGTFVTKGTKILILINKKNKLHTIYAHNSGYISHVRQTFQMLNKGDWIYKVRKDGTYTINVKIHPELIKKIDTNKLAVIEIPTYGYKSQIWTAISKNNENHVKINFSYGNNFIEYRTVKINLPLKAGIFYRVPLNAIVSPFGTDHYVWKLNKRTSRIKKTAVHVYGLYKGKVLVTGNLNRNTILVITRLHTLSNNEPVEVIE